MRLIITSHNLQQIIDYAQQAYPYEVCGLVGGYGEMAQMVISVPNASLTPRTRFDMERQGMVDAISRLQQIGQEVVAIFHSHPESGADPSEIDIAEATWPDTVNLIVGLHGLQGVEVQGWNIQYGSVAPAEVVVVD